MKIDSHQHFWRFNEERDSWINEEMEVIKRDFMPEDLELLLLEQDFDGCVAVQAAQDDAQTEFLLSLADQNDFIKGVVGWIDLQSSGLEEKLSTYSDKKLLKGFRHVLQDEPEDDYMLRPAFMKGVKMLANYDYTYDILIFPRHLKNALIFAQSLKNQRLVIDHLAKPYIKDGLIDDWKRDIQAFKGLDHVSCKVSGIITEADWHHWRQEDLRPYLDVAFEVFGTNRLMFGSDWPVSLLAGNYPEVTAVLNRYLESFSKDEKDKIMGGNATGFYKLSE